jgi:hypothetical protein
MNTPAMGMLRPLRRLAPVAATWPCQPLSRCALLALALIIACTVTGCCDRSEDYGWAEAPRTERDGLQVTVLQFRRSLTTVHIRLYLRNLTAQAILIDVDPRAGTGVVVVSGNEHVSATVSRLRVQRQSEDGMLVRVGDPEGSSLRLGSNSALIIDADASACLGGTADACSVRLTGRWEAGQPIALAITIPAPQEPNPRAIHADGHS